MPDPLVYPPTPARPEPNRIGGIAFHDPFQWLADETAEVVAWQDVQDQLARDYLQAQPVWELALATAARCTATALTDRPPELYGGRWFREHVPQGARNPVVEVAETPTGPGRTLVRRNDLATSSIVHWRPSPDGRRLAYGGTDPALFRVLDVDSGEILLDGLPNSGVYRVAWLPDSRRFFCVVNDATASTTYLVRLGATPSIELQPLPPDPAVRRVTVSADGQWALAHDSGRPCYRCDLAGNQGWAPFLRDVDGTFRGAVVGGEFIAVTDRGAPNGRVVAIPLDGSDWRELVPASAGTVLFSVTAIDDELILAEHSDGASRLRRLTVDGRVLGEIPLPDKGMAWSGPGRDDGLLSPAGNGCVFTFSSLTRSPAAYRYQSGSPAPQALTRPRVVVDNAVVRVENAAGVPYKVVAKGELTGPRPLVIGAYGALNIAWLPAYVSALPAAWVQLGGVYVHAHLRGGGEYGTEWWQAARRHTKQATFDDLYTVAADLIERGWTDSDRLGVFGASIGSLPAAVAVTQRPDLFRACVAMLPVLDLLRCGKDPVTMADIVRADLGDPAVPADAAVLHAYSPYHQVRDGTAYPAVMIDCGAVSRSCPAWHGRKMAARLQQATSAQHPILLRVRPAGHTPQTAPEDMVRRDAEQLAFFATELGLAPNGNIKSVD